MACLSPLTAWQLGDGTVVFNHHAKDIRRQLELPCLQCQGCRLERSRQWATRAMHEAQMHDHNAYVTLTYDDQHLPENSSLKHYDFQCFIKRLKQCASRTEKLLTDSAERRKIDGKGTITSGEAIKYYMGGEYGSGENTERPHYHAALFGVNFKDQEYFTTRGENDLYISKTLSELWRQGHCSIGELTFESAAYIARYCMKKITGDLAKAHYERINPETGEIYSKTPEYNRMSKGLGKTFYQTYKRDLYPHGKAVINGHEINTPRYYDKLYAKEEQETFENHTQWARQKNARLFAAHQTPERRQARARVLKAKLNQLRRDL